MRKHKITFLALLTLATGAAFGSTYFCPPNVVCTGNDISTCKVNMNYLNWQVDGYTSISPNTIHPGIYNFFSALAAGKKGNPLNQTMSCSYGTLDLNIQVDFGVYSTIYADMKSSNNWQRFYSDIYYACNGPNRSACPLSTTPVEK